MQTSRNSPADPTASSGLPAPVFIAAALAAVLAGTPAQACDFCMASIEGFGKTIRQAEGVADARVTGRQLLLVGDGPGRIATTFTVSKVLYGAAPEPGKAFRTTVQWRGSNAVLRAVVLFDRTEDGPAFLDALADPDGALADYFGAAFALDRKDAAARAAFFAARLEHPAPEIAEDAYRQFADIPFDAVRKAKSALNAGKLREWLSSDKVLASRKGLYGLMLGLVGDAGDADRLAKLVPSADGAAAAGGLMAGRCLLAAKPAEVLEAALADAKSPMLSRRGALAVVRFFWADGGIPKDDLRRLLTAALADPELAPYAVDELTRIRDDWSTGELRTVWLDPKRRTAPVRAAILNYLRELPDAKKQEFYDWLNAHP